MTALSAQEESTSDQDLLALLEVIADAFNRHDVETIMSHFADDAVFQLARGSAPYGTRLVGKDEIRTSLADRFAIITDMHWQSTGRWACGNKAVSQWVVTGTADDGEKIEYLGCDLWEFRGRKVVHKDTYWKSVD